MTSTGAINLSDTTGGLAVTSATTASGDITLNAVGGDLTLSTVTAGGTGRNISLSTTTSGNVVVDNVTATGDVITITSVGNIHEAGGRSGARPDGTHAEPDVGDGDLRDERGRGPGGERHDVVCGERDGYGGD